MNLPVPLPDRDVGAPAGDRAAHQHGGDHGWGLGGLILNKDVDRVSRRLGTRKTKKTKRNNHMGFSLFGSGGQI